MEVILNSLNDLPEEVQISVCELSVQNQQLKDDIQKLQQENAILKSKVAEKESQIKSDSSTSSKPPSHDWSSVFKVGCLKTVYNELFLGKSKDSNEEKRSPGKQPNSKGFGPKVPENAEKNVIEHNPVQCLNCVKRDTCTAQSKCTCNRKVVDIKVTVVVEEHKTMTKECPLRNNEKISGSMPKGLNSIIQFGLMIQALIIFLYINGFSHTRIHDFFSYTIKDAAPAVGTIFNIVKRFGESYALNATYKNIYEILSKLSVLHCDETGIRGKGKKLWLHVICTDNYTYLFGSLFRGFKALVEGGTAFLTNKILMHDCWRSYFKISECLHALCNAHIIRELANIIIFYKQEWAQEMLKALFDLYEIKKEAIRNGKDKLDEFIIQEFKNKICAIANKGINANPLPEDQIDKKRPKQSKPRALAGRILEYLDEIIAFAVNFDVPFTNNIAEQAIRIAKIKIKNSTYVTLGGLQTFAKIQSVLDTAKKQKIPQLDAIKTILSGNELDFRHIA